MSLTPFDSFQSRFVTYLLNCPRTLQFNVPILLFDNRTGMSDLKKNTWTGTVVKPELTVMLRRVVQCS